MDLLRVRSLHLHQIPLQSIEQLKLELRCLNLISLIFTHRFGLYDIGWKNPNLLMDINSVLFSIKMELESVKYLKNPTRSSMVIKQ